MKKLMVMVLTLSVVIAGVFAQDANEAAEEFAKDVAAGVVETSLDVAKEAGEAAIEAAQDKDFPTGTWVDSNWNAEWIMDVAKVHLYDAANGELVYTFTKHNTEGFKLIPSADGVTLSFTCAETHRSYKITKPFTLNADLVLEIDPDWTDENYKTTIKFKSVNIPDYVNK